MLSKNRTYDFLAELVLHKSKTLPKNFLPKDDVVSWLFLEIDDRQFSFIYDINDDLNVNYDEPFTANIAFTMKDFVIEIVSLNRQYLIFRGQEASGSLILLRKLV